MQHFFGAAGIEGSLNASIACTAQALVEQHHRFASTIELAKRAGAATRALGYRHAVARGRRGVRLQSGRRKREKVKKRASRQQ
jgi:hypothetical protein